VNISSVGGNDWLSQMNSLKNSIAVSRSAAGSSTAETLPTGSVNQANVTTNSDGDTVELSGKRPPPPPPPHGPPPAKTTESESDSSSDTASSSDTIESFLEKLASGTVTESDLTDIQSFLQQIQQSFAGDANASGSTGSTAKENNIKDFLDKIAAGKVTESDLQTMQAYLQQMQQMQQTEPNA